MRICERLFVVLSLVIGVTFVCYAQGSDDGTGQDPDIMYKVLTGKCPAGSVNYFWSATIMIDTSNGMFMGAYGNDCSGHYWHVPHAPMYGAEDKNNTETTYVYSLREALDVAKANPAKIKILDLSSGNYLSFGNNTISYENLWPSTFVVIIYDNNGYYQDFQLSVKK